MTQGVHRFGERNCRVVANDELVDTRRLVGGQLLGHRGDAADDVVFVADRVPAVEDADHLSGEATYVGRRPSVREARGGRGLGRGTLVIPGR